MTYDYTSMKDMEKPRREFWGVLARKAQSIVEDDDASQQYETSERSRHQMSDAETKGQVTNKRVQPSPFSMFSTEFKIT